MRERVYAGRCRLGYIAQPPFETRQVAEHTTVHFAEVPETAGPNETIDAQESVCPGVTRTSSAELLIAPAVRRPLPMQAIVAKHRIQLLRTASPRCLRLPMVGCWRVKRCGCELVETTCWTWKQLWGIGCRQSRSRPLARVGREKFARGRSLEVGELPPWSERGII